MSVAVIEQEERAILVALRNNNFDYSLAAAELKINEAEVENLFNLFKQAVIDGRLNATWLSERDVARELDCGLLCAKMLLKQYDHLAIEKNRPNGQKVRYFPPALVSILRPYFNLSEGGVEWFTVTQIKNALDKDFDWVRKRLEEFHSEARLKIAVDGKLRHHYPETVLLKLEVSKNSHIQAGGYLHVAEIARQTGQEPAKIRRIIDQHSIKPEVRYVSRYGLTDCYSPHQFERIKQILKSTKHQGDWITAYFIAKELGQTYYRVLSLIKLAGIVGEERFSETANRIHIHYPPETLALVKKLVDEIKPHEGWFTSEGIQKLTGKSHSWVRKRLKNEKFPREVRVATNNVPRVHYAPWVAIALYKESRRK